MAGDWRERLRRAWKGARLDLAEPRNRLALLVLLALMVPILELSAWRDALVDDMLVRPDQPWRPIAWTIAAVALAAVAGTSRQLRVDRSDRGNSPVAILAEHLAATATVGAHVSYWRGLIAAA